MSRQLGSDKSSLPSLQSTAFSLYPHMAETEMERASKLSVSLLQFSSVQSLSRVRLFATLDCSMRGFPVYHQLPGLSKPIMSIDGDAIQASHLLSSPSPPAFNLVHWFCDAIQPSHLLSSPSPPAFNLFQHMHHTPTQPIALKNRSFPWLPICLWPFITRMWALFFASSSLVKRPAYTQGDKKYTSELTLLFAPKIVLN